MGDLAELLDFPVLLLLALFLGTSMKFFLWRWLWLLPEPSESEAGFGINEVLSLWFILAGAEPDILEVDGSTSLDVDFELLDTDEDVLEDDVMVDVGALDILCGGNDDFGALEPACWLLDFLPALC